MYEYKAKITNVVDGDTVDAVVDVGFQMTITHRLRLLGVNCPEMHGPDFDAGQKAKDFTKNNLLNQEVIIHTEKSDVFGRYLATIYLDGIDFCQELIDRGYAVVYKR